MRLKLIAVVVILSSCALAQQASSLGEVARQKTAGKKAKRVITNDDIPSRETQPEVSADRPITPATSSAAVSSEAAPKEATTSQQAATTTTAPDSERIVAAKKRVTELDSDIANLKTILKDLDEGIAKEEDDSRREVLQNMHKNRTYSLERATVEKANLQKEIEEAKNAKEKQ